MISFSRLGKKEGLGNQLFQYAFLRTTAKRLAVKFACPPWPGEGIFTLNDDAEKAALADRPAKIYCQPTGNGGFTECALNIADGTDVFGFFQSEKYFDPEEVRRWFTFHPKAIASVQERFAHSDLSAAAAVHLRFGDMKKDPMFVILPPRYYARALARLNRPKRILVFSDEIDVARRHLAGLRQPFEFIEGNRDFEDLYLITRCRDIVCSVSTFSWWGAWLNPRPDKAVIAPLEWLRPGSPMRCPNLNPSAWVSLRACWPVVDDYRVVLWRNVWKETMERMRSRSFPENVASLARFLKRKVGRVT